MELLNAYPVSVPIKKIIDETANVKTFVFEHELGSKPGQFVMLWLPGVNAKPFSVAYDNGKEFWITFYAIGDTTKKMFELKEGDLMGVLGPYGTHYTYEDGQHLATVGGGYGAAPTYFLATQAIERGCTIEFILGARSEEHLLFVERVKALKNVNLHIATDDGSAGHKGYNTEVLKQVLAEESIDGIYTCGPELMEKAVSDIAHEADVPCQISLERYMKCGFGVCGSCCVDPTGERLCREGVVVDNEFARSLKDFGKYHRDSVGLKKML